MHLLLIKGHPAWHIGARNLSRFLQLEEYSSRVRLHNSMDNTSQDQVMGFPIKSTGCAAETVAATETRRLCLQPTSYRSSRYNQRRLNPVVGWMSRFGKQADSLARGIREHVSLGPKISETVKGKLSLGAKILQAGGVERVFRQKFSVEKGEKLLKAFQCYLSTTTGPISGLLFVSTRKIAFHSDRSLRLTSPKGNSIRVPYKVLIPIEKVEGISSCGNVDNPNQKYIQIVTVDEFEFWFMGFLSFGRSFKYLKRAISES